MDEVLDDLYDCGNRAYLAYIRDDNTMLVFHLGQMMGLAMRLKDIRKKELADGQSDEATGTSGESGVQRPAE